MTRLMKDEFIKNLDSLEWMSDETKAMAKEKVRQPCRMDQGFGCPDD